MFQNIKVDIIYYKTNTDFEMEFNLSGCCRMRLLTDKAPDRKILVSQLARAVSRSRIIIMTGSLFGEQGTIKTAAIAIGKELTVVNNSQFGINGDHKIEIIKNSVPLVSTDGIFGGCIIEQGPQTLILLSENKTIRKNIMQTLIHSYIQEICAAELTEKAAEVQNVEQSVTEPEVLETVEEEKVDEAITDNNQSEVAEKVEDFAPAETIFEEKEYDSDEGILIDGDSVSGDDPIMTEEDFYDEDEKLANQMVMEDADYLEEVTESKQKEIQKYMDDSDELIFEPELLDGRKGKMETMEYSYMNTDADDYVTGKEAFYEDEESENIPHPLRGMGLNLPITIIAIVLLIVAAILCYSIFIVPKSEGVTAAQYLKEAFDTLFV